MEASDYNWDAVFTTAFIKTLLPILLNEYGVDYIMDSCYIKERNLCDYAVDILLKEQLYYRVLTPFIMVASALSMVLTIPGFLVYVVYSFFHYLERFICEIVLCGCCSSEPAWEELTRGDKLTSTNELWELGNRAADEIAGALYVQEEGCCSCENRTCCQWLSDTAAFVTLVCYVSFSLTTAAIIMLINPIAGMMGFVGLIAYDILHANLFSNLEESVARSMAELFLSSVTTLCMGHVYYDDTPPDTGKTRASTDVD